MKKTLKLIPAIAMLLISAVLVSTSTYAWFSMNTTVTATGMQVKAVAEKGILINEVQAYNSESWDDEATGNESSAISLRATSTTNTSTWYRAYSKKSSSSASATSGTASTDLSGSYTTLSLTEGNVRSATGGTEAARSVYYVDSNANTNYDDGEGYYVKYTYYIKSSADAISCGLAANAQNLNVAVTAQASATGSTNLNKALRVAVVSVTANKVYIFAPFDGATTTYYVNAGATATTAFTTAKPTGLTSIPSNTSAGSQFDVYIYFEGEDANAKTDNVTASLDNLSITISFSLTTNAAAVTDDGVAIPTP